MAIILILFLLLLLFYSSCTVTLEEKSTNLRFFFRLAENSSNALRTFPFSVSWLIWNEIYLGCKEGKDFKKYKNYGYRKHNMTWRIIHISSWWELLLIIRACPFSHKNDIKAIFSTDILIFSLFYSFLLLHFFPSLKLP